MSQAEGSFERTKDGKPGHIKGKRAKGGGGSMGQTSVEEGRRVQWCVANEARRAERQVGYQRGQIIEQKAGRGCPAKGTGHKE